MTLWIGTLGGVLLSAPWAYELLEADPREVEYAEVVAVDETGWLVDLCGKREGPRADITWRSEERSDGAPATFIDHNSCDGDVEVGARYRIVRSGDADDPSVLVVHASSWSQVAAMFGFGGGVFLVLGALVTGIPTAVRGGYLRLPWKRRTKHAPPDQ